MSEFDSLALIEYPENNYKLLLGCFFGISSSWGIFFICGTYQDYYSQHQLSSSSTFSISWIFSIYYFFIVAGNLLSGLYFDISGFNKFLAIPLVIGFVLIPFVENYWEIMVCFILLGLGGGILIPPILGCLSDNFYAKRNLANSIAIAGGILVGVVYPVILQKGFDQIGYRNTNFIVSGLLLIQLGLCLLLCNDRKELRRSLKKNENFWSIYFKQSFDYDSLINDRKFILVSLGITTGEVSTSVLLLYIASYCSSILDFSDSLSFNMITVLNVGTLIGGCTAGIILADRIGKINCLILASFSMIFLNLVFWLALSNNHPSIMYAYSLLWGFNYGAFMSLCPSIVSIVSNYYNFGKKYSTIYFVVGIGFLAGIPVSGVIIGDSKKKNFDYFIIYATVLMVLCLLSLITLKIIHLKDNLRYKIDEIQSESTTRDNSVNDSLTDVVNGGDFMEIEFDSNSTDKDNLKLSFRSILSAKY